MQQSVVAVAQFAPPQPAFPFIRRLQTNAHVAPQPELHCYSAHAQGRNSVETYIAATFREQYGAQIDHFLPVLLTLEAGGEIRAAVGIRFAGNEPLFVEHYLDRPIADELEQRGIASAAVVEIGNLVSTRAGNSQLLFILLAKLLHAIGCDTGVFTVTGQVKRLLDKIDCPLQTLCAADGRRLGAELEHWGSYYDSNPQVATGNVDITFRHLQQRPAVAATFSTYADSIARIAALMPTHRTALPLLLSA